MPDTAIPRAGARWAPIVIGLIAVTGCGKSVLVEERFPEPLVETLPLNAGVYYDEELQNFSFVDTTIDGATWSVDLGSSNVRLFDKIFSALFSKVVKLDYIEAPAASDNLDVIISPVIEEFAFLAPNESGSLFWAVSIRYRMELYDGEGNPLTDWPLVAYGKSRSKLMRGDESLAEATNYALRDAAAALAVEIPALPEVVAILSPSPAQAPDTAVDPATPDNPPSVTTESIQVPDDEQNQTDERDS